MMEGKPKVSIIMATYNRAHFIEETLDSIINQTFGNWECLIIDDGSTDNSRNILEHYLNRDPRFKLYSRTSKHLKGLPGCRNQGLELAKGDYVIFFDDDDIVHPQNLELCVFELSNKNVAYCKYGRNTFTGKFHYNFDYSESYGHSYMDLSYTELILKHEYLFNSCSAMWKKECFAKNRFVEHLMYAEEWELYSRILSTGIVGISIENVLFYGRKHFKSNTGEFYNNDPIRRKSYADAILLAIENLRDKNLLSYSLKRYFISQALGFKEFNLFNDIIKKSGLSLFQKIRWQLYYTTLPPRLILYRFKNRLIKKN
jgi:glycosyltransferase involved in cell wall biosynthesis